MRLESSTLRSMKIKPGRLDKTLTTTFLSVGKKQQCICFNSKPNTLTLITLTVLFSFYAELNVVVVLYSLRPVIDVLTLDIGLEGRGEGRGEEVREQGTCLLPKWWC